MRQKDPVTWASPVGLTTGSVAAGNSVTKSLLVTVSNLAVGTYNTSVLFRDERSSRSVISGTNDGQCGQRARYGIGELML